MENVKKTIAILFFLKKIKREKILYLKILPVVLIVTYLCTIMVPRYYVCTVQLAPESNSTNSSLGSLASSFGINGLGRLAGGQDALTLDFYPDLLQSNNFIITLFPINIKTKDGISTTYYDYMANHQKYAVWTEYIIKPVFDCFDKEEKGNFTGKEKINVGEMNVRQQKVVKNIASKITCNIDRKTDEITISVQDQDPLVCATISDSILQKLQNYIIDYRTKKARADYEYLRKLRDEAKAEYDKSRVRYAAASDANRNSVLQSVKSSIDNLDRDMQLKYNNYSTLESQAQLALAKIQERTPVVTVINSPTVPYKPAGPKRMFIAILMTVVASVLVTLYILKDDVVKIIIK